MRGATSRATACPRRQRRGRMEPKAEGKGDAVPHIGPRTYKQRDGTVKDERGDPGKSYTPPFPYQKIPQADQVRHSPDRTHGGTVPLPARR